MKAYVDWLTNDEAGSDPVVTTETMATPPRETRVHVAIDPATGMGREGALFSTEGLAFADQPKRWDEPARRDEPARALLCRVATGEDWAPDDPCFAMLGGERRLVELHKNELVPWPACTDELRHALTGATHLRLVLATPALFGGGWRPGWIDENTLEGAPPERNDIRLRLVSAAVGRRTAVSGWNMQRERDSDGRWKEKGPKAARYMAPAGSVYFFEVLSGPLQERQIDELWMASLSDEAQDCLDGYGLALPGVWQPVGLH